MLRAENYTVLPTKMVGKLEPNLRCCDVIVCVQVCSHLAIEKKFRGKENVE